MKRAAIFGAMFLGVLASACSQQKLVADGSTGISLADTAAADIPVPTAGKHTATTTGGRGSIAGSGTGSGTGSGGTGGTALTGTASATASAGSGTGPSGGLTTTSTAGGASSAGLSTTGTPPSPTSAGAGTSGGVSTGGGSTGGGVSTGGGASTTGPSCPDYGPDLDGNWTMTSYYELAQAGLPPLDVAFTAIDLALNTLQSSGLISIPTWLIDTFDVLDSFDVVFNDLEVVSALNLSPGANGAGDYVATETWNTCIATLQNGSTVDLSSGQVAMTSPDPYDMSVCMPTATFAEHSIGAGLAGLVGPLLDGAINISSQGNLTGLNGSGGLFDYLGSQLCGGNLICGASLNAALSGPEGELQQAIDNLTIALGVAEVWGTGTVESAVLIDQGIWYGTDGAGAFPGSFTCTNP